MTNGHSVNDVKILLGHGARVSVLVNIKKIFFIHPIFHQQIQVLKVEFKDINVTEIKRQSIAGHSLCVVSFGKKVDAILDDKFDKKWQIYLFELPHILITLYCTPNITELDNGKLSNHHKGKDKSQQNKEVDNSPSKREM